LSSGLTSSKFKVSPRSRANTHGEKDNIKLGFNRPTIQDTAKTRLITLLIKKTKITAFSEFTVQAIFSCKVLDIAEGVAEALGTNIGENQVQFAADKATITVNAQSLLSPFFCAHALLEDRLRKGKVNLAAFFLVYCRFLSRKRLTKPIMIAMTTATIKA